jgi:hypothetical protein
MKSIILVHILELVVEGRKEVIKVKVFTHQLLD